MYKAVTGVKSYEKCLIEDNSGLDCIVVIEDDIWKDVALIDGENIKDVIDDIDLVLLLNIFIGTSGIICGVVITDEISDVVFGVDMSTKDEDAVKKSWIISKVEVC